MRLPPIRICEKAGKVFTIDRRRLVAVRLANVKIGYEKVDANETGMAKLIASHTEIGVNPERIVIRRHSE